MRRFTTALGGEGLGERIAIITRIHGINLDIGVFFHEFLGHALNNFGDGAANGNRKVERKAGLCRQGIASTQAEAQNCKK